VLIIKGETDEDLTRRCRNAHGHRRRFAR
jgi:hypothetical protein